MYMDTRIHGNLIYKQSFGFSCNNLILPNVQVYLESLLLDFLAIYVSIYLSTRIHAMSLKKSTFGCIQIIALEL